jgi:hypothetical protein
MKESVVSLKNSILKHFWDFFMLFLAVTLGFFVDNYRDKYNEKKLAKELAAELVQDIQFDTLSLRNMLDFCAIKKQRLDSLYLLIDDETTIYNDSLIYFYSAHVNNRPKFERSGQTFALFTNTSYLNSFSKEVALSITKLDISYSKTMVALEHERNIKATKIFPFQQQIFHTEIFQSIIKNNTSITKPILRNWNKDTRWLYHNYVTELKIENQHVEEEYDNLLKNAKQALEILKKEYAIQ